MCGTCCSRPPFLALLSSLQGDQTFPGDERCLSVHLDWPAQHRLSAPRCRTLAPPCIAFILEKGGRRIFLRWKLDWTETLTLLPRGESAKRVWNKAPVWVDQHLLDSVGKQRVNPPDCAETWAASGDCYFPDKGETYQKLSLGRFLPYVSFFER